MKELKGCRKFDVPENDNKSNNYLNYANTSKTKKLSKCSVIVEKTETETDGNKHDCENNRYYV